MPRQFLIIIFIHIVFFNNVVAFSQNIKLSSQEAFSIYTPPPSSILFGLSTNSKTQLGLYVASKKSTNEDYGWYGDISISIPGAPPDNQVYSFSKYTAEEVFMDSKNGYRISFYSLNLGRTAFFSKYFTGFAAIGFGGRSGYQGYYDRFGILGNGGNYFLKDSSSSTINFEIGAMIFPRPEANLFHFFGAYSTFLEAASIGAGIGW